MLVRQARACIFLACLLAGGWLHAAELPEPQATLAEAANFAQERCYRLVHDDTFAFHACMRNLLQEESEPTLRRLGMAFFGWVGAVNSLRMGMRGAETAAFDFLPQFRAAQRALGVDDATLCQSIPGDCAVRLARLQQMEATPVPMAPPDELQIVRNWAWLAAVKKALVRAPVDSDSAGEN